VRTLVISDLHLGARSRIDLVRRPELRASLLGALEGIERVVLLGDTLELRHGPVREALAAAEGFLRDLGAALGPGREVVLVAGNHDHHLFEPWLERRARGSEPPPLELEETVAGPRGELLDLIAGWLEPARLRAAYPGVWLRPDVYAMHGHYLDRHVTVPTFERLAVGVIHRLNGSPPVPGDRLEDYEAALAPVYAWIHAMAQAAPPARGVGAHGASAQLWQSLAGGSGHRPLRSTALRTGVALTIATLNRAGLGPLRADVSGVELRRAGLRAMGEVVERLGIAAEHVIFGHTHRAGPWPGDAPEAWMASTGARLVNTGNWVYEPHFLTRNPNESPYWPGVGVVVDDEGPPRLERFLGYRGHAELRPAEPDDEDR